MGAVGPGARSKRAVKNGEAIQVATGAMIPPGADAVVPKEYAEISESRVIVKFAAKEGSYVYVAGDDFHKGDLILTKGRSIRAQDIGLMIGFGLIKAALRAAEGYSHRDRQRVDSFDSARGRKDARKPLHVFLRLIESMGCIPVDGGVDLIPSISRWCRCMDTFTSHEESTGLGELLVSTRGASTRKACS